MIPTAHATRYVTPLREGGSLPGIVEADDLGTYVCRFRGAGQGVRVLVAEVVVAELARRLGLSTPRTVVLELGPGDRAVRGRRGGPGPAQGQRGPRPGRRLPAGGLRVRRRAVAAPRRGRPRALAGCVLRQRRPQLAQPQPAAVARQPLADRPRCHALLPPRLAGIDSELRAALDREVFREVLAEVPDVWLEPVPGAASPAELRPAYVDFLGARIDSRAWLPEASV